MYCGFVWLMNMVLWYGKLVGEELKCISEWVRELSYLKLNMPRYRTMVYC